VSKRAALPQRAPGRSAVSFALAALLAAGALAAAAPGPPDRDTQASAAVSGEPEDGFTLPFFPIGLPGVHAYNARVVAALDHAGTFYTQCCDTTITVFTGESVSRGTTALACPAQPVFPECFVAPSCVCAYGGTSAFQVTGGYTGGIFGPTWLLYDGHAGWDYDYARDTPIVAPRAGRLCKAMQDEINGELGAASAWDAFHTFYVDHGEFAGIGYASWFLHADALDGVDLQGAPLVDLEVGDCANVASGQLVARVGNFGTFLPHLHFELRVHDAALGPEDSPQVVDPYGWTGDEVDPWSTGTNRQALSRTAAVWVPEPPRAALTATAMTVLALLRRYSARVIPA
jgi:hypothetical protein